MTSQPNQSTVSLQSMTPTVMSEEPLRQTQPPPKDFAAALGALQSRYGTGAGLPNPKKEASKKLPGSASTSPVTSVFGSSQATLATASVISQSSQGSSSTNSGTSSRTGQKSKDKKPSVLKALFKGKKKAE